MIIENENGKFWLDDSLDIDTMTGLEMKQSLIPYQMYADNKERTELEEELVQLNEQPDEICIPNDDKISQIEVVKARLEELNKK